MLMPDVSGSPPTGSQLPAGDLPPCKGREVAGPADTFQLSLVIPAYNEAATIRQAVQEADAALAAATAAYEIIVVDDGSTDEVGEGPVRRLLPPGMAVTGALNSGRG